jgi:hypothetical protein
MHDSQVASEPKSAPSAISTASQARLYDLDARTRDLLIESAPLMAKWSTKECKAKPLGGMEKWAKQNVVRSNDRPTSCEWYHGTWQYLRLLNMVAVPPWYSFYRRALSSLLRKKPQARVLISACADYGMLDTLLQAIIAAGTTPTVVICDICATPLLACDWYAKRHGLQIECICDNLFTTKSLAAESFDIIVTDEFFTVLSADDKPLAAARWKELLKPGGAVVTTAMIGKPTTPDLRARYAEKGRRLLTAKHDVFCAIDDSSEQLVQRIEQFATFHTRHMIVGDHDIRRLLSGFYLGFVVPTITPGECVNPTYSLQIVATLPHLHATAS